MGVTYNWEEVQSWGGGGGGFVGSGIECTSCSPSHRRMHAHGDAADAKPPLHPPDPAVFAELAECVQEMLKASLERFVIATYNNVGTRRALCGSAGGIVIGLAGRYVGLFCAMVVVCATMLVVCASMLVVCAIILVVCATMLVICATIVDVCATMRSRRLLYASQAVLCLTPSHFIVSGLILTF